MGLVQRALEEEGISTISTSVFPHMTERVKPPRAVVLKFPRGVSTGAPGDVETQRRVILDALNALKTIEEPGTILELPHRWKP